MISSYVLLKSRIPIFIRYQGIRDATQSRHIVASSPTLHVGSRKHQLPNSAFANTHRAHSPGNSCQPSHAGPFLSHQTTPMSLSSLSHSLNLATMSPNPQLWPSPKNVSLLLLRTLIMDLTCTLLLLLSRCCSNLCSHSRHQLQLQDH